MSREIAQGILHALRRGAGEHTVISKRARLQIDQVIEELPDAGDAGRWAITGTDAGAAHLWTFAGTRANRTIARQIKSLAENKRIDAIGIDLKTPIDPSMLNAELFATELEFSPDEVKNLSEPIKFSECLPSGLLLLVICARQFG